ncbi:MAG: OsmC family protein [Lacibacter sp.]
MVTSYIDEQLYRVTHDNGRHRFYADEPADMGGGDTAPSPDELLEAALASCTLATLRMYTRHKGWQVGRISITVQLVREKEKCIISRNIRFEHPVTEAQLQRLQQIAKACPLSRTLAAGNELQVTIQS